MYENMARYSLRTIRNKAYEAGYKVSKGFRHYLYNGAVVRDCNGEPYTGYIVEDLVIRKQIVYKCVLIHNMIYLHFPLA